MASNPPQVTPVPIPVPGSAQSAHSHSAPPASQPLGATAGSRNISPSAGSVSSTGEGGRKMKRTGAKVNVSRSSFLQAPSWATSLLNSKPASGEKAPSGSLLELPGSNSVLESPEPVRIVSDILWQNTTEDGVDSKEGTPGGLSGTDDMVPSKTSLSKSAKIQALQQSWMNTSGPGSVEGAETDKDWLGGGLSSEDGSSSQPSRKRSLGASQGGDLKRRLTEATTGTKSPTPSAAGQSDGRSTRRSQVPVASQATAGTPNSSARAGFIPIQRTRLIAESSEDATDEDATDEDLTTEDDGDVTGPASLQEVEVGQVHIGKPPELSTTADSDRPYTQWKGPSGLLEPTCGVLLPTGYSTWTDPAYPWICPVRDCRNIFRSIIGLGKHFGSRHKNAMFNDNLDGTLTEVGSFYVPGLARSSGVIVSRNPLRGNEPPMAEPEAPVYKGNDNNSNTKHRIISTPGQGAAYSSPDHIPSPQALPPPTNTTLLQHITSHLSPGYSIPTERPDIKALLKLPIKRALPEAWIMKYGGVGRMQPLATFALLVFLTGDLAPAPCQMCLIGLGDGFDNTLRPCVVLTSSAPSWLRETASEACACCQWACNYKRWKMQCDLLPATRPAPQPSRSSLPARVETPVPPPVLPSAASGAAGAPYTSFPKDARFPYLTPKPLETKCRIAGGSVAAPAPAAPTTAVPTPAVPASAAPTPPISGGVLRPTRRVTRYSVTKPAAASASAHNTTPTAPTAAVSANPEQTMPAEILEMEDWEVAPGRVRDERSETPTNVAFSNAYLTSNQAVAVSEGISFNVVVIKPGGTHQWTDEVDRVRICSLAVGKVSVRLDKTDPFSIGPNGMFKLKPGVACSIENRTYIDAVVHVTSVAQY